MRADRLLSLVMFLQTRGKMTTYALADELHVSRRTILRDIDALSGAGIPIYTDGGHGGGVALDENYRTSLTGLKEAEIRSLFISANNQLLADVGLGAAAESSLLKLAAALPSAHQPSVDYIRQRIHIDPLWWWHNPDPLPFWDDLQRAVYDDRTIRMIYENYDGDVSERLVQPYSLVAKSGLWYLIARREDDLRTYRVARIHNVEVLPDHFQRAADFDLATYWAAHVEHFAQNMTEYAFTLRVHTSRLNFVKWIAPGRVRVHDEGEGQDWVAVDLHMESIDLAKMLVFGLGKDASVINPPELEAAVIEGARAVLEK